MKGFIFENKFVIIDSKDSYVAYIDSKSDLLEQLKTKLNFPDYFGYNWDALNDCLADFSWIEQKNITIVHTELPDLDNIDMSIYVRILTKQIDGWDKWENGKIHQLEVVFPTCCRGEIEKYMYESNEM